MTSGEAGTGVKDKDSVCLRQALLALKRSFLSPLHIVMTVCVALLGRLLSQEAVQRKQSLVGQACKTGFHFFVALCFDVLSCPTTVAV